MINLVIGGSHSGKTTFVRRRYLGDADQPVERIGRVPCTRFADACGVVIGNYGRDIRTCGADQLGRNYKVARERILDSLPLIFTRGYHVIVMEGTVVYDIPFIERLLPLNVRMVYMEIDAETLRKRLKKTGVKYGTPIIAMTYKKAAEVFYHFKAKGIEHEIIRQY